MYTVKNKSVAYVIVDTGKGNSNGKVVKIYLDNLAIEVVTDKLNGGY